MTKKLSRRTLLRGAGAAMALPMLDAMRPASARDESAAPPRRMIAVCNNLGFVPDLFFPTGAGETYVASPYLEELAEVRHLYTAFDGVSHPGVDGSHASDVSFLTGAPNPAGGGFRNTISLDQYIAARIGARTRFPSLTLGVNAQPGRRSLSWTSSGALIPCIDQASTVYRMLFLRGSEPEIREQIHRLQMGRSIMDAVGHEVKSLRRSLAGPDRDRLEQYQTAVRDVERRLLENEAWADRPKPLPPMPEPDEPAERTRFMEKSALMYQMAKLAFETDSTRAVTLLLDTNFTPSVELNDFEITDGYHNLSHHGKDERKLAQLEAIDRHHLRFLKDFLLRLQSVDEGDADLLANTSVIYGSNLGDANKHTTTNMPMLLAGGRFKHGQALAFDRRNNYPLTNLFVSVLQQMGFDADRFATSTGTMAGLQTL